MQVATVADCDICLFVQGSHMTCCVHTSTTRRVVRSKLSHHVLNELLTSIHLTWSRCWKPKQKALLQSQSLMCARLWPAHQRRSNPIILSPHAAPRHLPSQSNAAKCCCHSREATSFVEEIQVVPGGDSSRHVACAGASDCSCGIRAGAPSTRS